MFFFCFFFYIPTRNLNEYESPPLTTIFCSRQRRRTIHRHDIMALSPPKANLILHSENKEKKGPKFSVLDWLRGYSFPSPDPFFSINVPSKDRIQPPPCTLQTSAASAVRLRLVALQAGQIDFSEFHGDSRHVLPVPLLGYAVGIHLRTFLLQQLGRRLVFVGLAAVHGDMTRHGFFTGSGSGWGGRMRVCGERWRIRSRSAT